MAPRRPPNPLISLAAASAVFASGALQAAAAPAAVDRAAAKAAAVAAEGKGDAIACETLGPDPGFGRLPVCLAAKRYHRDLCDALQTLAERNDLPTGFFARLIWQESGFEPNALSPVGAEGIAQFMPDTARLRGLANAFNPADALAKSAAYLSEMRNRFGNLGLAAVGYNAGEARVARLLDNGVPVPAETEQYVYDITGVPVSAWTDTKPNKVDYALAKGTPFREACLDLARTRSFSPLAGDTVDFKPWGAEIGGSFSPSVARHIFAEAKAEYPDTLKGETPMLVRARNHSLGPRARYTNRIGRDTRAGAAKLCAAITAKGGYCIVRKN
ncbi:MAG: lytic transglycosylase domain-containing protein [Pararhizobium sp.]